MRLEDCSWMDVEAYLKQDDRIMLILGATEQHGYLSLLTDAKIPQALADAASLKTGVLVAPPLNFGVSPYFLTYPGTISLRQNIFCEVVRDMVTSLYGVGFRRMLVLNGHGGNNAAKNTLTELGNELPGLKSSWYSWWTANSVSAEAEKHGLRSYHAAWIEAFPFTRVGEVPDGIKTPVEMKGNPNAQETRAIYGDGVTGGPYKVAAEIMDDIFMAALQDVLFELEF